MSYVASKSPTQGRPGFSIGFRHPCRLDSKGKPGLKMRRGLGTADPEEADALVAQMNQLLGDPSWWTAAKYQEALRGFDRRIVDAFYDGLQAGVPDSYELRNSIIALPGRNEGYARVLFVGTTGAGKTSLLRHLIGSDPDEDRFPSTSTAKTTVSDIEVIPADGLYRAVVTFFSEAVIQTNIEDCVLNACAGVWERLPREKVAERFLHHPDQRFRLSYVLGSWQKDKPSDSSSDEWDFGETNEAATATADESVSSADVTRLQSTLDQYVSRISALAQDKAKQIFDELLPEPTTASPEDREAAAEIFQSELFDEEAFHDIVQDVLEDVARRFDLLEAGDLTRNTGSLKWPLTWVFETEDRGDFLRQVRWFSSNFAPSFGRLLTPVVDGIRVMGPLYPTFIDYRTKVVLLDGQGLGHTPDSSNSVTTHITKRFGDVDAILLVDNAEQPIQAAAQSVLRAVASSGNYAKLAIAFTHFDQVKGLNLPTFADKRAHVLASVHSYLTALREGLNAPIVAAMERIIGESGAGRLSCDVTDGPVAYTQLLFDRGLALSYPWADVFGIDPGDVLFEGRALYAYNLDCPIAYNTNLVQPGEIKSWEELTAPKWSGKVLLEARGIVFPLLALAWGEDKAFDYLKRLVANKPLIIKGGTQTLESLAGGQGAVAVGGYGGRVEQFKDEGAPVEWARVSPVPAMIYTHMALKGAPHPNAALLWNAWSIGKEHLDALYARQRNGRLSGSKISPLGQKMQGAGLEIVYETGNAAEMQTLLVRAGAAIGGLK